MDHGPSSIVGVATCRTTSVITGRVRWTSKIVAARRSDPPASTSAVRRASRRGWRGRLPTAQASGVALQVAASRGLSVGLHTPSEVKAAITGYGSADKRQVGTMVAKVLGLVEIPRPADAADALAIALCHAWKGPSLVVAGGALTPAQRAWREAERAAR